MDILDTRYYWLNRKLLVLMGQWPYQDPTTQFGRRIFACVIGLSGCLVQITKMVTSERDFDLLAEIFTTETVVTICLFNHLHFWICNGKMKALLEGIRVSWMSLHDDEEREIFQRTIEDGRKYITYCTLYLSSGVLVIFTSIFLAPILDIIAPQNESHPNIVPLPVDYFIDQQDYFYLIMAHGTIVFATLITMVSASDTMYMAFLYHACAMFQISSHRLKHVFDSCHVDKSTIDTTICRRLAVAVECHRNAISYSNKVISAFESLHLVTLTLVIINISISLYCTAIHLEKGFKALSSLVIGVTQMTHMLFRTHPPQKLIDDSSAILFDAYSGQWYAAPFKSQTLLLFVMQRGTKPSAVVLGKTWTLSMESCAAVIETSISYFMTLLSFKSI